MQALDIHRVTISLSPLTALHLRRGGSSPTFRDGRWTLARIKATALKTLILHRLETSTS